MLQDPNYLARLRAVAGVQIKNPFDVEDLVQQAALAALASCERLRSLDDPEAWLCRVFLNCRAAAKLAFLRQHTRIASLELVNQRCSGECRADERLVKESERAGILARFKRRLAQVESPWREVYELAYVRFAPPREAAAQLGMGFSTYCRYKQEVERFLGLDFTGCRVTFHCQPRSRPGSQRARAASARAGRECPTSASS